MISSIDHILLFLFLFSLYFYWGKLYYNLTPAYKFWIAALLPLLSYSLIVGSRYGWGADYEWYKYRFEKALTFREEQIGFEYLKVALFKLHFSYVGAYIIYSLIFCVCALILIRSYKRVSPYMYGLFIPATLIFVTGIIRQGIALSFVFLMIYFLNKRSFVLSILVVVVGSLIHTTIFITAGVLAVFYFSYNRPISWKLSIPIYLLFTFVIDSSNFTFLSTYLGSVVSFDSTFQGYLDNSDHWFGADGVREAFEQGVFSKVMTSLFHIVIIVFGYFALRIRPSFKVSYIYNSMVVGMVLLRMFFVFEILRRFAEPLVMLYFVVLGYSLYILFGMKTNSIYRKGRYREILPQKNTFIFGRNIGAFLILSYLLMYWGRFIFLNLEAKFFWNI